MPRGATSKAVILKRDINVGVPVDMGEDKGLIVPVIHGADNYSVTGLARRISELANKARAGKLTLDEIQGGTITVNNTGALGTFMTSSIINQPQACLVTMESIVKRPVVVDDAIAIRSMTFSCIALDHRVLDGAVGAKFLRQIKQNLEELRPEQRLALRTEEHGEARGSSRDGHALRVIMGLQRLRSP